MDGQNNTPLTCKSVSSPDSDFLPDKEIVEYHRKLLERDFKLSEKYDELVINSLENAIKRAKETHCEILCFNRILFCLGLGLIGIAIICGVINQPAYTLIFGTIGLVGLISTLLIGSIDRTQKAIKDLIIIEMTFFQYYETVKFWERYGMTTNKSVYWNSIPNMKIAAENIQSSIEKLIKTLQEENHKEG
jgi:hypothetical protein